MQTFADAHAALSKYLPRHLAKGSYDTTRMQALMSALGNPQDKLKIIHVAGTSGKTSTCYYIASMLKSSGKKVGLTVSPHVDEVNERLQIDLVPLPEAQFCEALEEFIAVVDKTDTKPTYFELFVGLAYWYFNREKVDYAVIEVGLGGLHDGTNVVDRKDKVCVITDIGLDHVEVLGKNLRDIAAQKAGIIKPGNQVFTANQDPQVLAVLKQAAMQQNADIAVVPPLEDSEHDLDILPLFQRRNWWLAFTVFDHLAERDGVPILSAPKLRATMETYIPARMEIVSYKNKTIILDGAHNAQKMQILAESITDKFANQKIATLLAIKDSADFTARVDLKPIANLSEFVIVTGFSGQQDLPVKSVEPKLVASHLTELGAKNVEVVDNSVVAFKSLLKRPEEILLVTGSFYLMGHIRPLLT